MYTLDNFIMPDALQSLKRLKEKYTLSTAMPRKAKVMKKRKTEWESTVVSLFTLKRVNA